MTLEELIKAMKDEKTEGVDIAGVIQSAMDTQLSSMKGLKQKNVDLVSSNKALKKSASQLPEDFDEELWKTLMKEHEGKADAKLKAEGKWNELKEQLVAQHTTEIEKVKSTLSGLKSALSMQLVDNAAVKAITTAKGNSALLLPHIKAKLKMVQDEAGGYAAIVADRTGEQMLSKLKVGEAMSIEELVNEFKTNDQFSAAFSAPSGGGGAGGSGNDTGKGVNGSSNVNPYAKGDGFSYTAQAQLVKSNPNLAQQMKAAATA